jgi:hypothetical protein
VVGRNLESADQRIRYEIIRGAVDFLRACNPENVFGEVGTLPRVEYPVRRHVVGYAPQSEEGQRDAPLSFVSRSQAFSACLNHPEDATELAGADCWKHFARDRSLSSLDWKLVIPLRIGGGDTDNTWLMGEGLPEDERPIIEDIVFHFRYRTRPLEEN